MLQVAFVFALIGMASFGSYQGIRYSEKSPAYQPAQSEGTKSGEPESFWERTWHDPVATFTVILCAVTGLLAVVTGGLYVATAALARDSKEASTQALRASTEATRLAREEFIATHRPKLTLRGAFSEISDPEEGPIVVRYTVANVGESPTRIVQEIVGLEWSRYEGYPANLTVLNATTSNELAEPITLAEGQSISRCHESPNHYWDNNHRQICVSLPAPLGLLSSDTQSTKTTGA
jgi:hypothetical protein